LARWINAPTTGLELINENIMRNHGGAYRGKWALSVKSYRSIPNPGNHMGHHMTADRTMCAVTMNENVFVLLEDPSAPTRAESLNIAARNSQVTEHAADGVQTTTGPPPADIPPHYRTTYITITPPQSLELLLAQLRARWQSVRQATGQARGSGLSSGGAQLTIEGNVFAIGTDWLVRAGNVVLAGGTVRGMLLEAEYLPVHVMPVQSADGTSELLSNLLTSLLPRVPDARTVAVTIPPGQWEEVLYSGELAEDEIEGEGQQFGQDEIQEEVLDGVYIYGVPPSRRRKRDWQGIDRDRRAAFLIIGALKSEGLL
ncbi:hypothetical protein K439DRAFT_1326636, partial [Ramaria rubella]